MKRSGARLIIETVKAGSKYLEEIIKLGDKNSKTLGFFPRKAYEQKASEEHIIVAICEGAVCGYLLFSYNWKVQIAYIVHLCVDQAYRRKGVARTLFQQFESLVNEKVGGIRVRCRKDYEAKALWPRLGFRFVGERPGRSKSGSLLEIWRKDTGRLDLFSRAKELDKAKMKACLDYNILADAIKPNSEQTESAHAIMEDWLAEVVDFFVSPELGTEVDRDHDATRKAKFRQLMQRLKQCQPQSALFEEKVVALKGLFGKSQQDKSDLHHLSWCAAENLDYFVTNDEGIHSKNTDIYDAVRVKVIRPIDLLLSTDELLRTSEYQPQRFSESELRIRLFKSDDWNLVDSSIAELAPEGKRRFIKLLQRFLSQPEEIKTQLVMLNNRVLALLCWEINEQRQMEVHLLRMVTESLSDTISIGIIGWFLKKSIEEGINCLRISDKCLSQSISNQCIEFGFQFVEGVLIRWVSEKRLDCKGIQKLLNTTQLRHLLTTEYCNKVLNKLDRATGANDASMLFREEKSLWPLKISDLNLPTYVISIKPEYAMHLFDHGIAGEDLFGGESQQFFNVENAYYRAAGGKQLKAPARILWYVTKGNRQYTGTMAIRAMSYMNEVHIGKAKSIFNRFQHLGIYKWPNIRTTIKNHPDRKLMAFVFSHCEMFRQPVSRNILNKIWESKSGQRFFIRQPIEISENIYWKICDVGMNKLKESDII